MEISSSTVVFAVAFLALTAVAFLAYRRTTVIAIDPTGMPPGCIDGIIRSAAHTNSDVHTTGECDDGGVLIARHPKKRATHSLITYGPPTDADTVDYNIVWDTQGMVKRALKMAAKKNAKIILVVQDDTTPRVDVGDILHVYVPKDAIYGELIKTMYGRPADTFIVIGDNLADLPFDTFETVLIRISCGFDDPSFHASIFQDEVEQGYLAGMLAYNVLKGRSALFKEKNIFTKIYTNDRS
jgi:hypothetical protein